MLAFFRVSLAFFLSAFFSPLRSLTANSILRSPVEILAVVVIVLSLCVAYYYGGVKVEGTEDHHQNHQNHHHHQNHRDQNHRGDDQQIAKMFTADELSRYTGENVNDPILLGILGSVFDVSKGRKNYAPGGSYSFFAAKDASRAFVTGDFTAAGLIDSLQDLSAKEIKEVITWLDFYKKDYPEVGKLQGRYYHADGSKTEAWAQIDGALEEANKAELEEEAEKADFPPCNSKWSQADGGLVWCKDKPETGKIFVPRLVRSAATKSTRCACVEIGLAQEQPARFALFKDCPPTDTRCTT